VLAAGDGAVAPHRHEGVQEQVQTGGPRQVWPDATCSSRAVLGCAARLRGGKSCAVVMVQLQPTARVRASLRARAGQVNAATALVSMSGLGKRSAEDEHGQVRCEDVR
jgi:hypothetical protein